MYFSALHVARGVGWWGRGGGKGEPGYSINILVSKGEPLRV